MGKLILIEGTDCSGKETQSKLLVQKLNNLGYKAIYYTFPNYDSATGKIVGGPYLGKEYICKSYFEEGAASVPAKVASLYFAADRIYNVDTIKKYLDEGYIIILDRYIVSNMAHQGGKIANKEERFKMYEWLEKLEYDLLELPHPDMTIFLHMPYEFAIKLQQNREKSTIDGHESDANHLKNAENSYLELKEKYKFNYIKCIKNNKLRDIEDINEEILSIILK